MNRILVIATRQIGDVLLTTPLVRAARERWPQARIDVLGLAGTLGMLAGNADIAELIAMPQRQKPAELLRFARGLWRRYDLALVSQPGDRAHLLGFVAAPVRSGLLPAGHGSNWWKRRLLRHAVVADGDLGGVHVVLEKLALLDPWMADGPASTAVVPPAPAPLPGDLAAALQPGHVVVHAPSMWSYKQWPPAHWEALVRGLLDDGRQVVLTGSAGPRDQDCIAPLRALGAAPQLLDSSGRLDFRQLATLLRGCALYVGPDTSVSHLAAACGAPTLAVFGPTNPQRWAPWPASAGRAAPVTWLRAAPRQQAGNVTLLQADLPCVPCGRAGCEDHHHSRADCLQRIAPAQVLHEARALLAAG
jgi:heptosyltransferase-3